MAPEFGKSIHQLPHIPAGVLKKHRVHEPLDTQMKAVLHQMAAGMPAIDLFADAPVGNPKASAYLLAVYAG
jgi:hypothetical protein